MDYGHDEYCNCEDCWWSRGEKEVCSVCGCLVGKGCSHSLKDEDEDTQD